MSTPEISVCFPSRGRPDSLADAVASLLDHAVDPDAVEVLVAVDPDDSQTTAGCARLPLQARLWTAPERFGYQRLHLYLNRLVQVAAGRWCQWWNDDMRMLTPGWDQVMRGCRDAILWPRANHVPHANIVPAWPRAWSDAMGRVSPTMHLDTYLQRLGEALGRHDPVAVDVFHDRFDVTGSHNDATFTKGRAVLGPEGMVDEPFPYAEVERDAVVIGTLLDV